ncbi:hypothetical protein [Streptosporangium fragile]|uniref:hypothetical protein n=1 Tax=Streptosporangium fragile TaxID=46186 RepID=UPI0031EF5A01
MSGELRPDGGDGDVQVQQQLAVSSPSPRRLLAVAPHRERGASGDGIRDVRRERPDDRCHVLREPVPGEVEAVLGGPRHPGSP